MDLKWEVFNISYAYMLILDDVRVVQLLKELCFENHSFLISLAHSLLFNNLEYVMSYRITSWHIIWDKYL